MPPLPSSEKILQWLIVEPTTKPNCTAAGLLVVTSVRLSYPSLAMLSCLIQLDIACPAGG